MKALRIILITVVALVALVLLVSLFLPSKVHVERTAIIHAPVPIVFGITNNLHTWPTWDPWARMDPNGTNTFEGPPTGMGSVMKWNGEKMGTGSMTITESTPNQRQLLSLDFGGHGKAMSEMIFKDTAGGTSLTWTLDVNNGHNPMMRYMGLMMDKMVGVEYEKGLATLDSLARTANTADQVLTRSHCKSSYTRYLKLKSGCSF